jgi:hypothetical protein
MAGRFIDGRLYGMHDAELASTRDDTERMVISPLHRHARPRPVTVVYAEARIEAVAREGMTMRGTKCRMGLGLLTLIIGAACSSGGTTTIGGIAQPEKSGSIDNAKTHNWLMIGIRGAFRI